MVKIVEGERIGKLGKLHIGCMAVIVDATGEKVLLTQRADDGRWCMPSGGMDAGESVAECCIREVQEETGLRVRVIKLIGIYSNPHRLLEYPDGNRWQVVDFCFLVEAFGGKLTFSDETTAFGYFSLSEIAEMDVIENNHERIHDAFASQTAAFVK